MISIVSTMIDQVQGQGLPRPSQQQKELPPVPVKEPGPTPLEWM